MTKEEARNILEEYVKACKEDDFLKLEGFVYDEVIEAMSMGAKALSQPSLPSNLDEAAKKAGLEYAPKQEGEAVDSSGQVYDTDDVNWPLRCGFLTGFKAGAEWMAGQGETKEAVIGIATEEISINVSRQTLDKLDLCPGDKVVAQIRKK